MFMAICFKFSIVADDMYADCPMEAKQNKLVFVCLLVLQNLAEDTSVEKKMVNRKLPFFLVSVSDHLVDGRGRLEING